MEINKITKEFIQVNINTDVHKLTLKGSKNTDIDFPFAISQINSRQKAKYKLPKWSENFDLIFPQNISLEQSSSEVTANYKSTLFHGSILIDLTAGFGVDGITLSNQFNKTFLIEKQESLCLVLNHNIQSLHLQNIEVVPQNASDFIESLNCIEKKEITFYIDPARRGKEGARVTELSDCEPNILEIKEQLFQKGSKIIMKLSPMLDLKKLCINIPEITEIHIIAVNNECKELVAVCESSQKSKKTYIHTVNLTHSSEDHFDFEFNDEKECPSEIADTISGYLYEPNSAIMKSGGFKTIGNRYHLKKVDFQTHLYVSDELILDFPGRSFKIVDQFGFNKQEMKSRIKKGSFFNLSTRNFPLDTDVLKKQLQIKDGGDEYLFATTKNQKHLLILCHKC